MDGWTHTDDMERGLLISDQEFSEKAGAAPVVVRRRRCWSPTLRHLIIIGALAVGWFMLSSHHVKWIYRTKPISVWEARAAEVKDAFRHAYHSYEEIAFPHDELKPLSNGSVDNFNGWGVSALDSLDTMIIMGLEDEYERAMRHLKTVDIPNHDGYVPFFETIIRYLGGMLSAWNLSGDPLLLQRADQLARSLLPAFNTTSGFPSFSVVPKTGRNDESKVFSLAQSASCQMEYKYIAHITGRQEYFQRVEKVMDGLAKIQDPDTHLFPQHVEAWEGPIQAGADHFSMGAEGDSAYEYFLKQYLLSGKAETTMLDMYLSSIRGAISHLVYVSDERSLLYVTDIWGSRGPSHDLEHLSCFFPGLLALGARSIPEEYLDPEERAAHLAIAKGLATTCYLAYADTASGLGPETINFSDKGRRWVDTEGEIRVDVPVEKDPSRRGYTVRDPRWLSRPETIESLFILYRVTGEPIWRERGYEIFRAIERWSKGPVGYASVGLIDSEPRRMNESPSYFLAETLKYLYLLFKDGDGGISLDEYVFTTEAHPLPIFQWTDAEMEYYGIGPERPKHMRRFI